MQKEFPCSNVVLCKTIYLYLKECQNIYGSDRLSTTMIFCYKAVS